MNDFTQSVLNGITAGTGDVLPNISRPNYQREKSKSRIIAFDINPVDTDTKEITKNNLPQNSDCFPKLTLKTMGKADSEYKTSDYTQKEAVSTYTKAFAKTKNSLEISRIDSPDKRVCSFLKLPFREGNSVLTVYSDKMLLSYLFCLSSVLSEISLSYSDYRWDNQSGFMVKLFGSEENIRAAEKAFLEECSDSTEICYTEKPDSIIHRNVPATAKYAGGISNISEYQYINSIDKFYKENKDSMVEFSEKGKNLLATGEKEECLKALNYILRNIDRGDMNG